MSKDNKWAKEAIYLTTVCILFLSCILSLPVVIKMCLQNVIQVGDGGKGGYFQMQPDQLV